MKELFEPGGKFPVAVMATSRRGFFGNLLAGFCFAATWPVNNVDTRFFEIDGNHVKYAIENFDEEHPPMPWTSLRSEASPIKTPRIYRGNNGKVYHIWWNTWAENFGLYNPQTRTMYLLK